MQLVSFNVERYRSIKSARRISLSQETVLVGPNNEGKSNLLRALVLAMRTLSLGRIIRTPNPRSSANPRFFARGYEWERDFPQDLQSKQPSGTSDITLEFELNPQEVVDFNEIIGSSINGTLPIQLNFGSSNLVPVKVVKQGRGSVTLNKKTGQIARFVSERTNFQHIPAVRTASASEEIVQRLVRAELASLDTDDRFVEALAAIEALQAPILDRLAANIQRTLVQFLPDVTEVRIHIPADERQEALRSSCEIIVNDGTATLLQYKGDGVQSLAALGIMRHASDTSALGRDAIIAIEEPESHLHSGAIHELRKVLAELATSNQVVITTHNPLFVNRQSLASNVIVKDGRAKPAKSIDELRQVLGVRAADNLRGAELVLLVEGEDDKMAVTALLGTLSPACRSALNSGRMVIEPLRGASKLTHSAGSFKGQMCGVHVLLDNDVEARNAFDRALHEGVVDREDVNWVTSPGMQNSEFEDLIRPEIYSETVLRSYRVSLDVPDFHSNRKWSDRMALSFERQGQLWTDQVAREVKLKVAQLVAAGPEQALQDYRRPVVEALVAALEARLGVTDE